VNNASYNCCGVVPVIFFLIMMSDEGGNDGGFLGYSLFSSSFSLAKMFFYLVSLFSLCFLCVFFHDFFFVF